MGPCTLRPGPLREASDWIGRSQEQWEANLRGLDELLDAPRRLVFDAWTRPELLRRWLGVRGGWTMPVCELDLREGGRYRNAWRSKAGMERGVEGTFPKVAAPSCTACTECYDDPWHEGEALVTHVSEEEAGVTTCTPTLHDASREVRDLVLASRMESGVAEGFAMLDALLESSGRASEAPERRPRRARAPRGGHAARPTAPHGPGATLFGPRAGPLPALP